MRVVFLLLTAMVMAPNTARGTDVGYPNECFAADRADLRTQYRIGKSGGIKLANRAWLPMDQGQQCENIDDSEDELRNGVQVMLLRASIGGPHAPFFGHFMCRWYGYVEGALTRTKEVLMTGNCFECDPLADYWGAFGARLYCDLMIEFDKLGLSQFVLPTSFVSVGATCGGDWQLDCARSFAETAAGPRSYRDCNNYQTTKASDFFDHIIDFTGENRGVEGADFTGIYGRAEASQCAMPPAP